MNKDIKDNPLYKRMAKIDTETKLKTMEELKISLLSRFQFVEGIDYQLLEFTIDDIISEQKKSFERFLNTINK